MGRPEQGAGCPEYGFSAEVLIENKAMMAVFYKGDCKISSTIEGRVRSISMDFV
jgi:hypothetical protein